MCIESKFVILYFLFLFVSTYIVMWLLVVWMFFYIVIVGKCYIKSVCWRQICHFVYSIVFLFPNLLCCYYLCAECVLCIVIVGKCDIMYFKIYMYWKQICHFVYSVVFCFHIYYAVFTYHLNVSFKFCWYLQ